MSAYSSDLNPDVVKTALDDVFKQEMEYGSGPGHANATTEAIFKQDTVDNSAVILEVFKGAGYWTSRTEEQDVSAATPRIGNKITFSVTEYAQSIDIPKIFFDDKLKDLVSILSSVSISRALVF